MQHLIEQYRINPRNLGLRKKFIDLSSEKIAVLQKLQSWADRIADPLVKGRHPPPILQLKYGVGWGGDQTGRQFKGEGFAPGAPLVG